MNTRRLHHLQAAAIALAVVAAVTSGCSGGGGGSSATTLPAPAGGNQTGTGTSNRTVSATIRILIPPPPATSSARKRPMYISSKAEGMLIQATNPSTKQPTAPALAVPIGPGSQYCTGTVAQGNRTCTVTLTVPPGLQMFTFTTYDTTPIGGSFGSATPVGIGVVTETIVADTANNFSITLGGIVASITATQSATMVNFVPPAATQIFLTYYDPAGNAIANGPYVDANGNQVTLNVTATEDANNSIVLQSDSTTGCPHPTPIGPNTMVAAGSAICANYTGLAADPFTSTIAVTASNGPTVSVQLQVEQPILSTFGAVNGVTEYPQGIANEAGNIWVTTYNALHANTSGLLKITPVGMATPRGGPTGIMNITAGPASNLWATGTNVAKTNVTVYLIPPGSTRTAFPALGNPGNNLGVTGAIPPAADQIIEGPDGNLWYADQGTQTIYTTTTSGSTSIGLNLTSQGQIPEGLANSGTAVWFTQCPGVPSNGGCSIGEFRPGNTSATTFNAAPSVAPDNLYAIVAGFDGNLWFSQGPSGGQSMICMTQSGTICGSYPVQAGIIKAITSLNPDTAIWYADQGTNTVGRVLLNGKVTTYTIPDASGLVGTIEVNDITSGPDGGIWYTESDTSQHYAVGRIL